MSVLYQFKSDSREDWDSLSGSVQTGWSVDPAGGEGDDGRGPLLQDGRHRLEVRPAEGRVPVQHALGRVQGEVGGAVGHLHIDYSMVGIHLYRVLYLSSSCELRSIFSSKDFFTIISITFVLPLEQAK